MSDEEDFDSIGVSTIDSRADILAANNSAAWTLNFEKRSQQLKYLVCLERDGIDRRAFLVCKISAIRLRPADDDPRPRYSIEFEEYADAPPKTKSIRGARYPVRFEQLSDFGFDPRDLKFNKAPPKKLEYSYSNRIKAAEQGGIGIAEAKRRLAIGLKVREDQIDIIIRG